MKNQTQEISIIGPVKLAPAGRDPVVVRVIGVDSGAGWIIVGFALLAIGVSISIDGLADAVRVHSCVTAGGTMGACSAEVDR